MPNTRSPGANGVSAPASRTTPATSAAEQPRLTRIHAERVEDVAEVQPRRPDADADLVGREIGRVDRPEGEAVEGALLGDLQPVGPVGEVEARFDAGQPGDERLSVAQPDLGFVETQRVVDGRAAVGVDEHEPSGGLRLRRPDQAARPGGRQIVTVG